MSFVANTFAQALKTSTHVWRSGSLIKAVSLAHKDKQPLLLIAQQIPLILNKKG